jgi:MFS family permease
MNPLLKYMKAYHPMIHLLLLGSVFISLTSSMSIVFLPIYLINTSHLGAVSVGFLVGAGAITSTIGGFIGGTLSDLIGRNRLLLLALLVLGAVFLVFAVTRNMLLLLLANVLRGLFSSFFLTISRALMADLTPKDKRFKVFSDRYMAGNIGYSIGPMLGTFFGVAGNVAAFLLTSSMYLGYFILMYLMVRFFKIQEEEEIPNEEVGFTQAWNVFSKDRVLFLFIL